jgi:hypothetical protein
MARADQPAKYPEGFRTIQNTVRHDLTPRPFGEAGLALPASFELEAHSPDRPFVVTLEVAVNENGLPEVRRAELVADDGAVLEPRDLRTVPFGRLVQAALPLVAMRILQADDGGVLLAPVGPDDTDEVRAAIAEAFKPTERRRGRQPLTPERLREVAATYREALTAGVPPTQAVADRLGKTRAHAGRLVQRARAEVDPSTGRKYLGPTRRGKAGEVHP